MVLFFTNDAKPIKRLQNKGKCGYNVGDGVCVRVSKIGADGRITFKIEELDDNGE